jgi:N-acetylglucosamine-6-phosphate deacetylase
VTPPLYIHGATILAPGAAIPDGAVLVEGARIAAVGPAAAVRCPPGARRLDATGLQLAPGFLDLQINGAFGHDFTAAPEAIWEVGAGLPRYGVTTFLPTVITSPAATVAAAQAALAAGPPPGYAGAAPLGLHLEGPFLNPAKRGAHNPAHLRPPDMAFAANWAPGTGVRLVTLAPELPGALPLVAALVARGVIVSAGHSLATAEEARAGFAAGIRYGTHLFNAMPPLDHRAPGLAGALLAAPTLTVGLIADGIHLHPDTVALAWRAKGPARFNLVTDAMAALGRPPGRYPLGDDEVIVDGQSARLADGRLAGSLLSLDAALRNLIAFTGCDLAAALPAVTSVPAALLGLGPTYGRVAPGAAADLTLLTAELQVAATVARGAVVYAADPALAGGRSWA